MNDDTAKRQKSPLGLTHLAQRQWIGWMGLLLPGMVVAISWVWPVQGTPWKMLDSVSAFYYTSAGAVFVGTLFVLAIFLLTYGGYEGDKADRRLGKIAGSAALCVALFPTAPPHHLTAPGWWWDWMGRLHYIAAVVLFLTFIAFASWIFRRTSATRDTMAAGKRWQNRIYVVCALFMAGSVLWAWLAGRKDNPIFLPETIALVAFAISWLVKGRAHEPVVAVFRNVSGSGKG